MKNNTSPAFPLDKPTETRRTRLKFVTSQNGPSYRKQTMSYSNVQILKCTHILLREGFIDCQHGCNYINGKSMLRCPRLFWLSASETFTVKFICQIKRWNTNPLKSHAIEQPAEECGRHYWQRSLVRSQEKLLCSSCCLSSHSLSLPSPLSGGLFKREICDGF